MIRVAANVAWIVPGRVGGSEEYTVRLLRAVLDQGPADIDLSIVGGRAFFAAHPDLAARATRVSGPLRARPVRLVVEQFGVARATAGADVVHHFGGRLPARRARGAAHVVTVHDLQPLHLPGNFSPVKRRYLGWALPRSVEGADLVTTPSEWVRRTVVDRFGADPDRVRAVPSTWDDDTTVAPGPVAAGRDRRMVLYPAVTHPHKNHAVLVRAVAELAQRCPDVLLVLTGEAGAAEGHVREVIAATGAPVQRLGRVDAAQLRALVRRAAVLAFPSVYEGFGLPVLEAMRAGTPVVAGSAEAVAEVMGGTGTIVSDDSPSAWADALGAAMESVPEATAAARRRAEFYGPPAAADRLVAVWRAAAGRASTTA